MTQPAREVHYVLEIKVQEVINVTELPKVGDRSIGPKKERVINDIAHYVVKEKTLGALSDKGTKLLELSGE